MAKLEKKLAVQPRNEKEIEMEIQREMERHREMERQREMERAIEERIYKINNPKAKEPLHHSFVPPHLQSPKPLFVPVHRSPTEKSGKYRDRDPPGMVRAF